jgi:hypothetical protein
LQEREREKNLAAAKGLTNINNASSGLLNHPPSPQPPAQQPLPTGKDDDELATLLKGIMSFLSKRKM